MNIGMEIMWVYGDAENVFLRQNGLFASLSYAVHIVKDLCVGEGVLYVFARF